VNLCAAGRTNDQRPYLAKRGWHESEVTPAPCSRRLSPLRPMPLEAMMASSAFIILPCVQAPAASWNHALNPQPLPPGMYAPGHSGPVGDPKSSRRTGPNRGVLRMGPRTRQNGNGKRNASGTLRSVRALPRKDRIFLPLMRRATRGFHAISGARCAGQATRPKLRTTFSWTNAAGVMLP
jgi:hypothetical protein